MGFLTPIRIQPLLGRDRAVLREELAFQDSKGDIYRVPKGFETDGASVPRLLRWATPSKLETVAAAALHDRLYATGEVSKREADRIFREALEALDVSLPERWIMWAGVAAGGWLSWWGHRAED